MKEPPPELTRTQSLLLETFLSSLGPEARENFEGIVLMFTEPGPGGIGRIVTTACYSEGDPIKTRELMAEALMRTAAFRAMPPQGRVS